MSLKEDTNGLPQTFFFFKLEGYTFNIHADCQVYMLSDFPGEQPKTRKRSERTTDQSEGRWVAKWDCKANIVWRNARWSTPGYYIICGYSLCRVIFAKWHEHLCSCVRIFLKTHYQLACTAYVGLKFSINFYNVLYQINLSVMNFVPFILFYSSKLKHNYNELSRGRS